MSAETTDRTEENPYLAYRAAKIARNLEELTSLGLAPPIVIKPAVATTRARRNPSRPVQQPTRRSKRITGESAPVVEELPDGFEEASVPSVSGRKRQRQDAKAVGVSKALTIKKAYVPPANSVRRIHLPVNITVEKLLGRTMEKTGKAFVIQTSLEGKDASFNKYSGVQEWMNDAIFLWVNVGKKDDDIVNDFLDDGRQITWFGGSRMHDETPAVQKLLRVGTNKEGAPDSGIILWCRHYNAAAKTYHPYTCLGRLSYESHIVGSRPLQFVWNLLDYHRLLKHDDEHVRRHFQEIINL